MVRAARRKRRAAFYYVRRGACQRLLMPESLPCGRIVRAFSGRSDEGALCAGFSHLLCRAAVRSFTESSRMGIAAAAVGADLLPLRLAVAGSADAAFLMGQGLPARTAAVCDEPGGALGPASRHPGLEPCFRSGEGEAVIRKNRFGGRLRQAAVRSALCTVCRFEGLPGAFSGFFADCP